MHSIKNISERNKINNQSRADTYIRSKRFISKSDYSLVHLKVFVKLKKALKTLSSGQKNPKKPPKKTPKPKKKQKKPTGLGFLKKTGFFPTLHDCTFCPRAC